jgi:hypothetical protein
MRLASFVLGTKLKRGRSRVTAPLTAFAVSRVLKILGLRLTCQELGQQQHHTIKCEQDKADQWCASQGLSPCIARHISGLLLTCEAGDLRA